MKIKKSLLRKLIRESLQKLNEMPYLGYFDPLSPQVANPSKAPIDKFTSGIGSELTGKGYIEVAGFIYPFKDEMNLTDEEQDAVDDAYTAFDSKYAALAIDEDEGLDTPEKQELFLHEDELEYPEGAKQGLANRRHDYYTSGDHYQAELLSIVWEDLRFSRKIYINVGRVSRGDRRGQPHDSIKGDFAIIGSMIQFYNSMFPRKQGERPFYTPRRKYNPDDTGTLTSDLSLQQRSDAAKYRGGRPFMADVRKQEYGEEAQKALATAQGASLAGKVKTGFGRFDQNQLVVLKALSQAHISGDTAKKGQLRRLARQMGISAETIMSASRGRMANVNIPTGRDSDTRKFKTDTRDFVTVEDDFDNQNQFSSDPINVDSLMDDFGFEDDDTRGQRASKPNPKVPQKPKRKPTTRRGKKNKDDVRSY